MLYLHKLGKSFGKKRALDGVTLRVARGETLAIMGPSGCGKSTLLRCVQRIVEPDEGEIWFDGVSVRELEGSALRAYRRRIGFVFQTPNLVPHMSALENVALGPRMAGLSGVQARRRAEEALARVGLSGLASASPEQMSGGERQRVGIARALAMDPELILWDEPTAALDPILVEEVLTIMAELARSGDRTMVVVTHEIPFALRVADRLALMERGRIVETGSPEQLLSRPRTELGERYRRLYCLRHLGAYEVPMPRLSRRNEVEASRTDQSRTGVVTASHGPRGEVVRLGRRKVAGR